MDKKEEKVKGGTPSLYEARHKIQPRDVHGRFRRIKWCMLIGIMSFIFILPWIRWSRGIGKPDQGLLLDMATRRGYIFGFEFWSQEVYYLALFLIFCTFTLFFVTALFGRLWCGFTCPQTLWTDLFMWVERRIEGNRGARIRLDKAPWSFNKFWRRFLKHAIWFFISFMTGITFIGYFVDIQNLFYNIVTFKVSMLLFGFVALFTMTTYVFAGFLREQLCTYMCPWPRFQASLLDNESLIVTYQEERGEPRAKPARDGNYENRGHCIDCHQCVDVCPTGVDIRKGNQLACIGCGLCIDACNNVMTKVHLPLDLIKFDSIAQEKARQERRFVKVHWIRLRTILYAVILLAIGGVTAGAVMNRKSSEIFVKRERGASYIVLKNGSIQNDYTVRFYNKVTGNRILILSLKSPAPLKLRWGRVGTFTNKIAFHIKNEGIINRKIMVVAKPGTFRDKEIPLTFILSGKDGHKINQYKTSFKGP